MPELTLYRDELSPAARVAVLVCRNLNLDVEIKETNVRKGDQKTAEFLKLNPQHVVPTIVDHKNKDFVMWESRAIAAYLVESRAPGHHLFPNDVTIRAVINQRLYFDACTLTHRMSTIAHELFFGRTTEIAKDKQEKVYEAFGWMEGYLSSTKWMASNECTIADLSILSTIEGLFQLGAKTDNFPKLKAWYENCKKLPGFAECQTGAIKAKAVIGKNMTKGFD